MKRVNVINWDTYFMGLAHLSSFRSKDPSTQVGAVIVDESHHVVGIGYNGFPSGCSDDEFSWEREGLYNETKYPFVVHAELNAILNSTKNLKGCVLYVSLFPCNECAKAIIQSGIVSIVYESDKYAGTESNIASKSMLKAAKVELRQLPYQVLVKIETTVEND